MPGHWTTYVKHPTSYVAQCAVSLETCPHKPNDHLAIKSHAMCRATTSNPPRTPSIAASIVRHIRKCTSTKTPPERHIRKAIDSAKPHTCHDLVPTADVYLACTSHTPRPSPDVIPRIRQDLVPITPRVRYHMRASPTSIAREHQVRRLFAIWYASTFRVQGFGVKVCYNSFRV
jgi:hypothetical protein